MELTHRYIQHMQNTFSMDQWNSLFAVERSVRLSRHQIMAIVGQKDYTWSSLLRFAGEGLQYLWNANPAKRIRWDVEKTLTKAFTAQ